ncbi:DUF1775 domain-containing protein [Actinoplanes aureus]|uniref:DUF1775 domain-containing protein n=1 Tax=Actinoplanes aureus TaxID=2792083 RepID=A0A931C8U0_9ACTN|nr:DUF1775 domain-containing protein [Actinoplanes aureus]MBG0562181.1 DUF1775 domain-containing protein [Actinoplanes aureus]
MARRAGVLAAVTAAGVFVAAGPAAADVTVSPASAAQGSGANLYFHVTNSGTAPVSEVTLRIPADSPIAEVYPLSVDSWAPKIEWQDLSKPLTSIHNGTPVTKAPSAVTWIAVGKTLAPGQATDLGVAVGPLPMLSSLRFPVETRYADGKAGPAMAATLSLTPSNGAAPTHHGGGGDTSSGGLTPGEQAAFDKIVNDADSGPSVLSVSGWVVAVLALLGAGWVVLRNRHRATEEEPDEEPGEDESQDDDKEPVAAGSGDSKWSYKG